MSELRRDPILRRWVIIAPQRLVELPRPPWPSAFDDGEPCPFCPGNEHLNPVEIAAERNGDGWAVRVTPDRAPLLRIEGDLGRRGSGMFDLMNPVGAHELVADTPSHTRGWADFTPAEMSRLLGTYRARALDLRRDARFRHVLVLKNHGAAWSRFRHAHSHVVAMPFTPKRLEEELSGARAYFRMRERCVFCDQLAEECEAQERLVAQNDAFVTYSPFAAEQPYELRIVPRQHAADFGSLSDDARPQLAELLVDALARLRTVLGDPPYSVALHAGPVDGADGSEFHWHWEIVPRLGLELGMEWATGIYSNPVAPETAAAALRAARPGSRAL